MQGVPTPIVPSYPPDLPVAARREELLRVIADNQVVIVAGETGSGKSTQLPKLCLELGRGSAGLIGHTQPRRIAARAVAERVAEELGVELGAEVGYAVRFTDKVGPSTRLKVMTDGILLNELHRDRDLRAYDTIIVDEAHERSLNIDFILGYLRQLLPRRPDLKVIVTSATIDTERFSEHFGGAPIVEVSGRTYPVELRYRPLIGDDGEERDEVQAVCDAVGELVREGSGDVLVFATGEREIRDIADAVEGMKLPGIEVVPLFARLSSAEQHRVFAAHTKRRVVVATNIAETSITVPGIHYVVDPGKARISRYNKRTKVQRLPIEDISQASADQRAGRCGRIAPGICIRLFAEDDYDARPEFTEPEILRTNLASVILQMTSIGLGEVESFPFVEPPDQRHVADGVTLLEELGALEVDDGSGRDGGGGGTGGSKGRRRNRGKGSRSGGSRGPTRRLTPLGRRLARLPLDPTLGRMVLEAERHGCVHEVMVIAAALSIQDPRERPTGKEQQAAESHARFRVPGSDFLGYLALWDHLMCRQKEISSGRFRRECRDEFLHFVRIREWQDVYTQIRSVVRSLKIDVNRPTGEGGSVDPDAVHRALLAGLIGNVGLRDDRGADSRAAAPRSKDRGRGRPEPPAPNEYVGVRGASFALARGSALARKPPRWVMAAELVETNRLWARVAGTIQPAWIEQAAGHLLTYVYDSPSWNAERGSAQVIERVRLRQLTVVEGRTINLDRVDPRLARELFILHALVRGEWTTHHAFAEANAERIEEVRSMEDRARRRDLLVDDDVVFDFFDDRIPEDVTDIRRFDRWWRDESEARPDLLTLTVADLVEPGAGHVDEHAFPETWAPEAGGAPVELSIDYSFTPGLAEDGVTFEVPLAVLNRTDPAPFEWLVPGLRLELVTALIRSLPKAVRRNLVPAPDRAAEAVERIAPDDGALRPVLAAELSRMAGERIDPRVWDDVVLPAHLLPRFRVVADGATLAEGTDLAELERQLRPRLRSTLVEHATGLEADGATTWTFGDLPRAVETVVDGLPVKGYPTVIDQATSVGVRVLASPSEQRNLHWNGIRRLLSLQLERPARVAQKRIDARVLLGLVSAPHGSVTAATEDALEGVLDALMLESGPLPHTADAFAALLARVKERYQTDLVRVVEVLADAVTRAAAVRTRLDLVATPGAGPAVDDISAQLDRLVFPGMVVGIGTAQLVHLPRYLAAIDIRLDRLRENPRQDLERLVAIRRLEIDLAAAVAEVGLTAELDDVRWMIEELRVQQFAQQLGTAQPVSEPRIRERLRSQLVRR